MTPIPIEYAVIVAAIIFTLGLIGVVTRRNLIFVLMSIEIMLNAAALMFVIAGAKWGQADGQVFFIFTITMAAAEVAVGLALTLLANRMLNTLDTDAASTMKG
jgi:NADH-quinone oxidoreductase subunit K